MSRLEAKNICLRFDRRPVLDGVDFTALPGRLCALIGPNGAGKTTLLRVLARLVPPDGGEVALDGEPLARLAPARWARHIAYLPQTVRTDWPIAVARLVALGRLPHLKAWQRPGASDLNAIIRALERVGLEHLAARPIDRLSAGERARALLARALAVEPALLLVDEPVASLDPYHQLQVMELLRRLADDGAGIVVVLHDLNLAARFCDRITLLKDGRVLAEGTPREILTGGHLKTAYGVDALSGDDPDGGFYLLPWKRLDARAGKTPP